MKLSAQGAADIRLHEGFVDHWYRDPVGIATVGVGFTMRSAAFKKWWDRNRQGIAFSSGCTMTRSEADDALIYFTDEEYGAAVNKFLGKTVPQNVFDAMLSVVFSCGAGSRDWEWARLAKAGDYQSSADKLRTTAITAKRPDGTRVQLAGLMSRQGGRGETPLHGRLCQRQTVYPDRPGNGRSHS